MKKVIVSTILSMMVIGFLASAASALELPPPKRGTQPPSTEVIGWKLKLKP